MKKALSVLLSLLLVCGTFAFSSTAAAADETGSLASYAVTWPATGGGNNRITVHYGYVDDGTFTVFDESVFSNGTPSIAAADTPNFLIYDVKDYDYAYTCLRVTKKQEKRLQPILLFKDGDCRCFNEDAVNANDYLSLYDGENVYVVYTPKPETPAGGTATVYETGGQVKTLADVIVVYDVSGSMRKAMDGGMAEDAAQSRLEIGKGAIRRLANSLLAPEMVNREGQKLNRMALITFSTRAALAQDFTSDPDVFNAAVDAAEADGGTNWEEALQLAGRLSVDPGRDTVVILISDGDPTLRMTRFHVSDSQLRNDNDLYTLNQYGYYRLYSVFGHGTRDDMGRNYQAALTEASSLVDQGKTLYTVAISDAAPDMALLSQDAGAGEENSFTAQSEEELTAALDEIETRTLADYSWGGDPSQDAPAIVASGYCGAEGDGTNVEWVLYDDGTLTISGEGTVEPIVPPDAHNESDEYYPWGNAIRNAIAEKYGVQNNADDLPLKAALGLIDLDSYFSDLRTMADTVIVEEGITGISRNAFSSRYMLPDCIVLPASLQTMEDNALETVLTTSLTFCNPDYDFAANPVTVYGFAVENGPATPQDAFDRFVAAASADTILRGTKDIASGVYDAARYAEMEAAIAQIQNDPGLTEEEKEAALAQLEVETGYSAASLADLLVGTNESFGWSFSSIADISAYLLDVLNEKLGSSFATPEELFVLSPNGNDLERSPALEAALAPLSAQSEAAYQNEYTYERISLGEAPAEGVTPVSWLTIHGYLGSTAETAAATSGVRFAPLCLTDYTHSVTEKAETAPSCTASGTAAGWYCEDCGVYLTGGGTIDPINHRNAYAVEETEATETEHGHTAGVYCPDCEALIVGDVIHNHLGTQTVIQPPTEEEEGIVEIVCTVCGEAIRYSASWTGPEPDENGKTEGGFWQQITGYVRGIINWFLRLFKWLK